MRWIRRIVVRVVVGLVGVVVTSAGRALAQPAVLDRVSEGAGVIVAVGNVAQLDENAAGLLRALELDAISTLTEALGALGLREGLDLKGSAAGVFYNNVRGEGDGEGAGGGYVLLLPVSDFAGYVGRLKAERAEGGGSVVVGGGEVYRFVFAGVTYFARDLGGSLGVFGPDRELVSGYDGRPGRMAGRLASLGARGREVVERSDIVAITGEVEELMRLLEGALAPLLKGLPPAPVVRDEVKKKEGGGVEGVVAADPRVAFAAGLVGRIRDQSEGAVLAIRTGPMGVGFDLVIALGKGTELSGLAQQGPARDGRGEERGEAFRSLPKMDYLFVGSMNLRRPGMRKLFGEAMVAGPREEGGKRGEFEIGGAMVDSLGALRGVDVAAVGVYTPANLMSGALSRTVVAWEAADPSVAAGALRSFIGSLDGKPAAGKDGGGGRVSSSVVGSKGEAGLEEWSIGLPEGAGGSPASLLLLGFGERASGYLGIGERRGFITWSREEVLMEAAYGVAKGVEGARSAGEDAMVREVGAMLPRDRSIEWYLNARPILQQMAPLLAMMGNGVVQPRAPEALAPIGVSISLADSVVHASAFVPAPLIKVAVGVLGSIDLPMVKRAKPEDKAVR